MGIWEYGNMGIWELGPQDTHMRIYMYRTIGHIHIWEHMYI